MHITTKPSTKLLEATRENLHPRCIVCSRPGLGLEFQVQSDSSVTASFDCHENFEGFAGMLHGGVISAIADGAMTNCLFAYGITAVTAEMNVRFRHPIELGRPLTVTARIIRRSEPRFLVEAELTQSGQLKAKATGKFMEKPESRLT